MKVIKLEQLLNAKDLILLKDRINHHKSNGHPFYDELFGRYAIYNDKELVDFHQSLTPIAIQYIGDVKPSYNFISLYTPGQGICPKHTDRPQCKYTLGICVNQNDVWPINIAGDDYLLNEGDCIIYSGTDHEHYRNKLDEGKYCELIFFHFVDSDFEGELG